jgi:uncharacterized protein with von Willebrand factor type A (vWA) domain
MLGRVQAFAALLRKNGVRTSTAELLDAISALQACGLDDAAAVQAALHTTLVKRHEDAAVFDELFALCFFRPGQLLQKDDSPLVAALRQQGISDDEIERIVALLADQAAALDPTARMALGLGGRNIDSLLRQSGLRIDWSRLKNPLQIGFFTHQALGQLRFSDAQAQLAALAAGLAGVLGAQRSAQLAAQLEAALGQLRATVRSYVKEQFEQHNLRYSEQQRRDLLSHKPFAQLSPAELLLIRREIERLAAKLRSQASMRPRQRRRGRLDIRRTLRRALATGGLPFTLRLRQRRVEKPRLVLLCDISDSVRPVSRFMLELCYLLQELFAKVRSFVFVAELGEATDLFARHKLDDAVERALGGQVVQVFANSNYGRAFRQFVSRHLDAVTSRTTVIIIGDGRSNYFPPEAWTVERLRRRARHVLWLNPEQPASWMFGDSAMRDYQPHLSRVELVDNLESLRRVIDRLVL